MSVKSPENASFSSPAFALTHPEKTKKKTARKFRQTCFALTHAPKKQKKNEKSERKFRQTCFALTHTGWNKVREYGVTSGRVLGPLSHLQRYTPQEKVREDTYTEHTHIQLTPRARAPRTYTQKKQLTCTERKLTTVDLYLFFILCYFIIIITIIIYSYIYIYIYIIYI